MIIFITSLTYIVARSAINISRKGIQYKISCCDLRDAMAFFIHVKVNYNLIRFFADNKRIRTLAILLLIKKKFANGTVYNYTLKRLSDRAGISRNGLRQHIAFLEENGFIRHHCGNITFKSFACLKDMYGLYNCLNDRIEINKDSTLKEIVLNLRLLLFSEKWNQCMYVRFIRNDSRYNKGHKPDHKERRKRQDILARYGNESSGELINARVPISAYKLGTTFGCSKGHASKIMKAICATGKVLCCKPIVRVAEFMPSRTFDLQDESAKVGLYWYKGTVYKRVSNKYQLQPSLLGYRVGSFTDTLKKLVA